MILKRLLNFLAAFFSCWAIQLSTGITVRNPLTVVLFVLAYWGLNKASDYRYKKDDYKKIQIFFGTLAFILSAGFTYLIYPEASAAFNSRIFKLLTLAVLFCGFFALFVSSFRLLLFVIFKKSRFEKTEKSVPDKEDKKPLDKAGERKIFLLTLVVCLACYLPYFLYEFPGIMTADSLVQYEQIIGRDHLSNHHPVIHTMTIKLFYELGLLFTSDPSIAIAFYTAAQMLFLSVTVAVAVVEVFRILGYFSKKIFILLLAFFAFLPFNAVFSVTIWKDIPFAAFTVLLCCQIVEMVRKKDKGLSWFDFFIFGLLGIVFSLYRSNALYAFVVFVPFFLYCFKNNLKEALATVITCLALLLIIKGPVFKALDIKRPDTVEALSLPLQQMARVIVDDGRISEEDYAIIDACIDRTYIKELYAPGFADNIKELVRAGNPDVIKDNKLSYLNLYVRTEMRNPTEYAKAFYDLEGGYFFPDVAYKVADADGIMQNEDGLYSYPIIGGKFIKVKEILLKLSEFMPLYGMFFSIGAYSWALLICLFVSIKNGDNILIHLLQLLLILTLLIAAPLVTFRYAYAMVLSMPVWVSLTLAGRDK